AGVAPDAGARPRIRFVELDPKRRVERPEALRGEILAELLQPWLVADRRMRIRRAGRRLGRVFAALPVHVVELLGARVVRLQIVIGDRPRWRDAAVMTDFAEVLAAQPEQRSTVELRVSTYPVIRVRVEIPAVSVLPELAGLVLAFEIDHPRIPVVLLAADVVAAL